ncbi:hypothetical protein NDI45_24240 [Leptolyngbya sp. GB1-A1]|uniref:hypothetical protein n=1 Tax=Leptolyngbya sp. GB1-A1 TaxID=2933908 RepID=UPI00329778D5
MTAKVLESFGGKLAEQWVATLLTPAFIFWAGGLAAAIQHFSWNSIATRFSQQPEPLQIAILVGCLCGVGASAFVAQRFDLAVLRGLEGYGYLALRYWLQPFTAPVAQWFDAAVSRRLRGFKWYQKSCRLLKRLIPIQLWRKQWLEERWQRLDETRARREYVRCDNALHQFPTDDADVMPTRLGNILRAAERRPLEKYGLDAIVCWSRLWLLIPDAAKKDLQEARADLNTAVRVWLWSVLFAVWTVWTWWALPVAIIAALFAYGWAIDAAIVYADLIESAFDLYRTLLYQSLRWTLPANPKEEQAMGAALTQYLWRGSNKSQPTFTNPN